MRLSVGTGPRRVYRARMMVSPNFRLKRKEAKRKRKKGSERAKKVIVSLRFAMKLKKFF
jgi:hypothetical protein